MGNQTQTDPIAKLDESGLMSAKSAEAWIRVDLRGDGRKATAEDLGISPWSLDDRRRDARSRVDSLPDMIRALVDLDEDLDADLDVLDELRDLIPDEPEEVAEPTEPTETPDDSPESTASGWDRLMSIPEISQISRSGSDRADLIIRLDDPSDETIREVVAIVEPLGYRADKLIPQFGGGDDVIHFEADDEDRDEPRLDPELDLASPLRRDDESDEEDELPYSCADCGRRFASGAALGGHRRYCEARRARLDE